MACVNKLTKRQRVMRLCGGYAVFPDSPCIGRRNAASNGFVRGPIASAWRLSSSTTIGIRSSPRRDASVPTLSAPTG
ncbi:hypothetical protein WS75_14540 [Burkholderia sp. FL-7-2-10-S1-D7]|nr:hypothetical protein WS75_14540 [Burkholderia sp. FL-7-2-10-S1-D7]